MKKSKWFGMLAVVLALSMTACGNSGSTTPTTTAAPATTAAPTTAAAPETEAPAEEKAETEAPAETKTEAAEEAAETEAAETEAAETEAAETEAAGTEAAETEAAGTEAAETEAAGTTAAETDAAAAEETPAGEEAAAPAGEGIVLEAPAILTSIGQSADVDIANTLCTRAGVEVEKQASITAEQLPADCKTLILAVGGSSKGLGAAGIDADQELARAEALLAKAKEQGTRILALHTGGSARRGTLSDSFIVPSFNAADAAIVVSEGDTDGLMKGILDGNGTYSIYVDKAADCITALQGIFGK